MDKIERIESEAANQLRRVLDRTEADLRRVEAAGFTDRKQSLQNARARLAAFRRIIDTEGATLPREPVPVAPVLPPVPREPRKSR